MPETPTPRLGLFRTKSDGSENVNVLTDLNNNLDKLDTYAGFVVLPDQAARFATAGFVGLAVRQADTGALYVLTALPASTAANWTQIYPQALTVTSAANRPTTGNYDGRRIWRSDRDWSEVYDAGAWRVAGVAHVAAFADLATFITGPIVGQLATVTGEGGMLYQYRGAAWVRNERGLVASAATTPNLLGVGTGATDVVSINFAPPAVGCYRIESRVPMDVSAIPQDAKGQLFVGGSEADHHILPGPGGVFVGSLKCAGPWDFTSTAATIVKATILKAAGGASLNSRLVSAAIDIYYVGPTGVRVNR